MRVAGGVFLALVCAGCLPDRDNPSDSSQRPRAALVIRDDASAGGPCVALATTADLVATAPINHCLFLDARASTDPQDDSLDYRFFGPGLDAEGAGDTSGVLVLSTAAKSAFTLGEQQEFRVRVSDGGSADEAHASFVPVNRRPFVRGGRSLLLPEGGLPWSPGVPFEVTLDASGGDPDGDPVRLCWTIPPAAESCDDPTPTVTVPTDARRLTATVRAFDKTDYSFSDSVSVTVTSPATWISEGSRLARLDTRTFIPVLGSTAVVGNGGGVHVAGYSSLGNGTLHLLSWPDHQEVDTADVASDFGMAIPTVLVRHTPGSSRIWAIGSDFSGAGGGSALFAGAQLEVSGDSVTPVFPWTAWSANEAVSDNELDTFPAAVVSSSDDAWVIRSYGSQVASCMPDGTIDLHDFAPARTTGLAARPGRPEVWVSLVGAGAGGGQLAIFDRNHVRTDVPLTTSFVFGIAFADTERLWIYTPETGIALVEADVLRTLGSVEDAALLTFPFIVLSYNDGFFMSVDPATGTLWTRSSAGTHELRVDGSFAIHDGSSAIQDFDPIGGVYALDGGLFRGTSGAATGIAARTDSQYGFANVVGSVDWPTGGVWATITTNPEAGAFARVGADGRVSRTYGVFHERGDTELRGLDLTWSARASPDGRWLWGLTGWSNLTQGPTSIDAYRLPAEGATGVDATLERILLTGYVPGGDLDEIVGIDPLAPVNDTAGSMAWLVSDEATMDVRLFDAESGEQKLSLTFAEGSREMSRSLRSNDLCIASAPSFLGPTTITQRRIHPSGAVTSLGAIGGVDPFPVVAAAADADDACWFGVSSGGTTTLRAYSPAGVLLHTHTGAFTSILALSSHSLLVDLGSTIRKVDFAPTPGGAVTSDVEVARQTGSAFVAR